MNYLQDMFAQAQQGQAIDNLARAYGISSAQAQAAVDAMLPAFAVGLERTAQSQQTLTGLFGTMARNPYAQAFESPAFPMGAPVRAPGNDALAAMFGSPEVSRAVAAQAAATTGLSAALLKQMLPAIAAMVLGGLMKGGMASTAGRATGGFGDLLGGMLGGGAGGGAARTPLEDLLGGMFGGGQQGAPSDAARRGGHDPDPEPEAPAPRETYPSNPLEDLLKGMFGGAAGAAPEPDDGPPSRGQAPGRAQDPALRPFQDIFDQFFDPKRGR